MTSESQSPATPFELLDRLATLCRHDTTTGNEDRGLHAVRALFTDLDARIELFEIAPRRHNVLATWHPSPRVLLSTHLDTVPPFLPPRRDGDVLWGRGTCDAKGQIVAQWAAIRRLLEQGETRLAWLGVVGEETDSIGAEHAVALAPRLASLALAIDGEPTGNRLATGQRGSAQVMLHTHGVAAHSGTPERGRSAIWALLDWLQRLRACPTAHDDELGPEIWNVGRIAGGAAPNVVPAEAHAELFVRTLPDSRWFDTARDLAPDDAEVEVVSAGMPSRFPHFAGFEHAVVPFGSDAPRLRKLVPDGTVALVGPGHIELAHSVDEHLTGTDLALGVDLLVRLAQPFLAEKAR